MVELINAVRTKLDQKKFTRKLDGWLESATTTFKKNNTRRSQGKRKPGTIYHNKFDYHYGQIFTGKNKRVVNFKMYHDLFNKNRRKLAVVLGGKEQKDSVSYLRCIRLRSSTVTY